MVGVDTYGGETRENEGSTAEGLHHLLTLLGSLAVQIDIPPRCAPIFTTIHDRGKSPAPFLSSQRSLLPGQYPRNARRAVVWGRDRQPWLPQWF